MPSSLVPIACWLADFHCLACVMLLCAVCVLRYVKQPARRLVVSWATMLGLLLIAALSFIPNTPRVHLGLIALPEAPPLSVADARSAVPKPLVEGSSPAPVMVTPVVGSVPSPVVASLTSSSVLNCILIAYLSACAGAGCWLAYGWFATWRLLAGSRPAGPTLQKTLVQFQAIPKRIRLRVSNQIDQPIATGLFRPTIVLPAWILNESRPQAICAALSHELAHVRRGDLWLLAVSRWLLVPLFCNPLYWWMRKQIWFDQELLADNAVARHWDPVNYAELLVAWSRQSSTPRLAHVVAMSLRTSSLRARIVTLLDGELQLEARSSFRWKGAVALVATVSVMLVSSVSLIRGEFRESPWSIPASHTSGEPLVVRLPRGVELELVGIRQHPCEGESRWAADGRPMNEPAIPLNSPTAGELIVRLRKPNSVEIDWLAELSEFRKLDGDESQDFATTGTAEGELYAFALPSSAAIADVRLQLNIGTWRKLGGTAGQHQAGQDTYAYCVFSPADTGAVVHVSHPLDDQDLRVVAIDFCDREVEPSLIDHRTGAVAATFAEIGTDDIRELYMQTREQQWVEFRNVSLRPGQRTDVKVVARSSPSGSCAIEL